MPRMTIYQEVEISIEEFDDDALLAEIANRNLHPPGMADSVSVDDLFLAMKWGNNQRALELLREYLMNVTGRIL